MLGRVGKAARELAQAEVATRLKSLRARPYSELLGLPLEATEKLEGGKRAAMTIYRNVLADGRVQVVVQASIRGPWFLPGMFWGTADGFRTSRDGTIEPVPQRDLYEFM